MVLAPNMAHAGFEFVSPSASATVAPTAATAPEPVMNESVTTNPIEEYDDTPVEAPVRMTKKEAGRADLPLEPIAVPLTPVNRESDALSIESRPLDVAGSRSSSSAMPSAMTMDADAGSLNEGGTVEGFGRSVPLAIALQQIVPATYRYSFEPPVNPSMRISWSGGKSWKAIIADIARTNNLNVDIASNVVSFSRHSPMDMIAAGTLSNSPSNMVQGIPLTPLAGSSSQISAPSMASAPALPDPIMSAPAPVAAPVAAPRSITPPTMIADATPPVGLSAPRDISDAIFDKPVAKSAAAPSSWSKSETPSYGNQRTALASISDEPLGAPQDMAMNGTASDNVAISAPTPIIPQAMPAPEASQKSAFFDGLMDQPAAANGTVKEKKILTADNGGKPMDILDKNVKITQPLEPSTSSQSKTVVAPIKPLPSIAPPLAAGNGPYEISKQVENPPVSSNELSAPTPLVTAAAAPLAPVSTDPATAQADLGATREWVGTKNQTVRQTLTAWAEQAGTSLVWSTEYDYPLQTDVRIQSTYADAVRTLLAGFSKAQPRPVGRLFKNDKVGAQPVLIIETQRLTD